MLRIECIKVPVENRRIGKSSEKLARSRRCKEGASPDKSTGEPGRKGEALKSKSEDLPDTDDLHGLRTMALCKNRLAHSEANGQGGRLFC